MSDRQAFESRVRAAAKRLGWRVKKSRTKNLHSNDRGMYQLIDDSNTVIGGADYDATLESIAYWIERERQPRVA